MLLVLLSLLAAPAAALPVVDVPANIANLPPAERAALVELVSAAAVIDELFLRQVWAGNAPLVTALAGDPAQRPLLREVLREHGPWRRAQSDRPFVPGVGAKPPVGTFYPAGSTRQELETWMAGLDGAGHAAATSPVTTIRRAPDGRLVVVPYSREYQPALARAAAHLQRAAAFTTAPSLRDFLQGRATAFVGNDYKPSDLAWMKLDAVLEPTIGPYEVFEDGWFNAKADFQAIIGLRDPDHTAMLKAMRDRLQVLEDALPLPPAQRSPDVRGRKGAGAPLSVIDVVAATGDVHRALGSGAFVLPNDESITAEHGAKRTLLRNVHQARWRALIRPGADRLLAPPARGQQDFEAFFTHLVVHELMHLLGPREITVGGHRTSVRERLQETHAPLEEAKADVTALLAMRQLADEGVMPRRLLPPLFASYLGAALATLRAGTTTAHGQGTAVVVGSLLAAGAVKVGPGGFALDADTTEPALRALARDLLAIQADGDRARARKLIAAHGKVPAPVHAALPRLGAVPAEVTFRFVTGEKLLSEVRGPGRRASLAPQGGSRP